MTIGAMRPRGLYLDDVPKAARRARRSAGSLGLLVLVLAAHAALPAPARAVSPAPAGAAAGAPRTVPLHRSRRSGLEARVATLTRALDLDPEQRAAVRKALQDQRQQVQRIWNAESASAADRIAAIRRVSTGTADKIRAILNEDQRKRYDPPTQVDPGKATRSANVEDWMKAEAGH